MNNKTSTRRCFIYLNAAILLWGITPLLVKVISIPVVPLIVLRCLIAAVALLAVCLLRRVDFRLKSAADTRRVLFCGFMMGLHWVAYFLSIRVSSVAVAVIAMCTYPVLTILLEPLMRRERLRRKDILTGVVVLIGVATLVRDFNLSDHITQGVLFGVLSALLFAFRGIISRSLVQRYDSTLMMMYQTALAGLLLLPALLFTPITFAAHDYFWIIILGLVFTAASHTLYIASLVSLKAKTTAIMQALTPLYSTGFAILLIGEQPTLRTLIGGSIVLSAALYEAFRGYK
ncbi:MAG: DMT family transporter [Kiritimatiellae bacterium]|nr:DMT family transporter [Kiritimatiellia bacterium]